MAHSSLGDGWDVGLLLDFFHARSPWLQRVVETFVVDGASVRRSVSLTIALPNGDNIQPVLIPAIQSRRGVLIDNLDVEDASGRSVAVLSRLETRDVAILMLESELRRLLNQTFPERDFTTSELSYLDRLRWMLRHIPAADHTAATIFFSANFADDGLIEAPERLRQLGKNQRFRDLVEFMRDNTLKILEMRGLDAGERFVIKYAYDSRFINTAANRVRRLVGQFPFTFTFDAPLAFQTPSYHARMQAPEGHYCYDQDFRIPKHGTSDSRDVLKFCEWTPPKPIECEGAGVRGLPYAHLYVNALHEIRPLNLKIRMVFYEIPPGHQSVAFIVSLITTVILIPVGAAYGRVVNHAETGALILAAGGMLAVWLRPRFDSRRLLQAPLSAKLGLAATGTLSVLGALDLIFVTITDAQGAGYWVGRAGLFGLAGLSALCTAVLGKLLWRSIQAARGGVAGSQLTG